MLIWSWIKLYKKTNFILISKFTSELTLHPDVQQPETISDRFKGILELFGWFNICYTNLSTFNIIIIGINIKKVNISIKKYPIFKESSLISFEKLIKFQWISTKLDCFISKQN